MSVIRARSKLSQSLALRQSLAIVTTCMALSTMALSTMAFSTPVLADDVTEQIEAGKQAYQAGDVKGAIEELKFAVAQLQEQVNSLNAKLLPEPLPGWEASEVENASAGMVLLGGGTQISRRYSKGDSSVSIELLASPIVAAGIASLISNPAFLAGDSHTAPYRYQRFKGTLAKDTADPEINLMLNRQVIVKLQGEAVSKDLLEQYLKRMDLAKIKTNLSE